MLTTLLLLALAAAPAPGQAPSATSEVGAVYPDAYKLYLDLHRYPELSSQETQTAATLAARLRALGYDVTEHVGGTGVVAVMKNGPGASLSSGRLHDDVQS